MKKRWKKDKNGENCKMKKVIKINQAKKRRKKSGVVKCPQEKGESKRELKFLKNKKDKKNWKSKGKNKKKDIITIDSDSNTDKPDNSGENSKKDKNIQK